MIMKISDLKLPRKAIEFLNSSGYESLYPPQEKSIRAGLLKGKNIMVSAPTAGGKTLIAEIAILNYLMRNRHGKAIYLSPLRALAAEKYREFKRMGRIDSKTKINTVMSTGDYSAPNTAMARANLLVMTNERLDSITRHRPEWIDQIGLVIADEIHLVGDADRGPALEIVLTKMMRMPETRPQLLGLSATVSNAGKIAKWMGAKLVSDDWRPVPLIEGTCYRTTVTMNDGSKFKIRRSTLGTAADLGIDAVSQGGQVLSFAMTRARSASFAEKVADAISKTISAEERRHLREISDSLLQNNDKTPMVKTLARVIGKGAAFHHAGLNQNCREAVEDGFRRGRIKLISSTPTLAAGINIPARRVIITSASRYDVRAGYNKPISIAEYKQLCGRAGRPQYDDHGEAILVSRENNNDLRDKYVRGKPEPIKSKIKGSTMSMHVLGLVAASDAGMTKSGIIGFFSKTLGGIEFGEARIRRIVVDSLSLLEKDGMVASNRGRFAATAFGQKISLLYIDPATAARFRDGLLSMEPGSNATDFLVMATGSDVFFPKFYMRDGDYAHAYSILGQSVPDDTERISRSLLVLYNWISEMRELDIFDRFAVESGDLYRMIETSEWLIMCMGEISRHLGKRELAAELSMLRKRIRYGVKAELADLVSLKGVGRVRARQMYRQGIRTRADIPGVSTARLARIGRIGAKLAKSIKSQVR